VGKWGRRERGGEVGKKGERWGAMTPFYLSIQHNNSCLCVFVSVSGSVRVCVSSIVCLKNGSGLIFVPVLGSWFINS
jgi:hypothetical protein